MFAESVGYVVENVAPLRRMSRGGDLLVTQAVRNVEADGDNIEVAARKTVAEASNRCSLAARATSLML